MRTTRRGGARGRRGVEAVEFAMILPLFFVIMFATIDYSWYMFQRGGVADAARVACRTIAQMDPRFDDVVAVGGVVALDALEKSLVPCGGGLQCEVNIEDMVDDDPSRVVCEVTVDFRPITGFLGQSSSTGAVGGLGVGGHTFRGIGMLPDKLHARSVAVYEAIP